MSPHAVILEDVDSRIYVDNNEKRPNSAHNKTTNRRNVDKKNFGMRATIKECYRKYQVDPKSAEKIKNIGQPAQGDFSIHQLSLMPPIFDLARMLAPI